MWSHESTSGVDYSHGWLIPLISFALLWHKRKDIKEHLHRAQPHPFGLVLLASALIMHAAGLRMQIPHTSAVSIILALWASVWITLGADIAIKTAFPFAFLLFAVPIEFLTQATFPLRLIGSIISVSILNGLGIETARHGTAIISGAGQGFALDVADPCSGIRSLMSLMALTAAYAYMFRKNNIVRWFMFLCSIPIAMFANIGRIITVAVYAVLFGQDAGMKIYHDYSGYIVFVFAVLLVMALDRVLNSAAKKFSGQNNLLSHKTVTPHE